MRKEKNSVKKYLKVLYSLWVMVFMSILTVGASASFQDSNLAQGTLRLIQDVTGWGIIVAIAAGTLFVVFFAIRRGGADQQERKEWDDRIKSAVVFTVIAVVASGIINLVVSYYR